MFLSRYTEVTDTCMAVEMESFALYDFSRSAFYRTEDRKPVPTLSGPQKFPTLFIVLVARQRTDRRVVFHDSRTDSTTVRSACAYVERARPAGY